MQELEKFLACMSLQRALSEDHLLKDSLSTSLSMVPLLILIIELMTFPM